MKGTQYTHENDDIYSSDAMAASIRSKAFIDYDGDGEYLDDSLIGTGDYFRPSTFNPERANYVVWFNR